MIICGGSIISLRLRCDDGGFGKGVLGGWFGDMEALYEYGDLSDACSTSKTTSWLVLLGIATWAEGFLDGTI